MSEQLSLSDKEKLKRMFICQSNFQVESRAEVLKTVPGMKALLFGHPVW